MEESAGASSVRAARKLKQVYAHAIKSNVFIYTLESYSNEQHQMTP